MKKKIFKYFALLLIFLSALMIWFLADKNFSNPNLHNWNWMLLFIFIFFVVWSLGAIIIRDVKIFMGISFSSLFVQIFFSKDWKVLAVILISFFLLWIGRKYIRREMKMRLKVDIWNYLRVGRKFFIFAVALMLAGQYYFSDNVEIASENLPKMTINPQKSNFVSRVVTFIDPNLIDENKQTVTVDRYIAKKFNDDPLSSKRFGEKVDFENIGYNQQEVVLKIGREDISKMVERQVAGEEKMADIFMEIINNRLDDLLNVSVGYVDKDMPVAHLIFTGAIFLAIVGIGMIGSVFLVLVVAIIFRFLVLVDLLSVEKKAVNMEIIKIT